MDEDRWGFFVSFIVLEEADVFAARSNIDDHFTQAKNIVAGLAAAIGTRLVKGTIDGRGKIDLVPESIDENQSCTSCESFIGAFKLQSHGWSTE